MSRVDEMICELVHAEDEALLEIADAEEFAPEPVFSDNYHRNMEKLYRRARKKRVGLLARAVLIAAIVVTLVGALTVGANWTKVISIIYHDGYYDKKVGYFQFMQEEVPDAVQLESWQNYWFPDYIPEDYQFSDAKEMGGTRIIIFKNSANEIIEIYQFKGEKTLGMDSEGTFVYDVQVNGEKAQAFEKLVGGVTVRSVSWVDSELNSFLVEGTVSFEELTSIAESLIFMEG